MSTEHRSPLFRHAAEYVAEVARLDPVAATFMGIGGYDDQLGDYSLEGAAHRTDAARRALARLADLDDVDEADRIARGVMVDRLSLQLELDATHESMVRWGAIGSVPLSIRQAIEMMPGETEDEIDRVTSRLAAVPTAYATWRSGVAELAAQGVTTPRRHVLGVAAQLETFAEGAYVELAARLDPHARRPALHAAAMVADREAGALADWLRRGCLASASVNDAVGEERYALWAASYTGSSLDLRETYEWGLQDLREITGRMRRVASSAVPGAASLREVATRLDEDPRYLVRGTDELLARLRAFLERAVAALDGTHFDIDARIRHCDVRIAPAGSAAAPYYTGPSDDLSRPGTTWFPTLGQDVFSWWSLPSTWYHEGVPGHHLQIATAVAERNRLSAFQRLVESADGYVEGWALYAERLMDDLGAFDDPGEELGFLSGQALRAARVVVDIGLHLGLRDPRGEVWTAASAVDLLVDEALLDLDYARSEVDRYLAIPGQAISYKVGERAWLATREAARGRVAGEFSLRRFHARALLLGPMGLDRFTSEMSTWDGR